jgi:hypothetical protein
MSDTVPVRLNVGGQTIAAGATRQGQWWTVMAYSYPGIHFTNKDLVVARQQLEKRLLAEIQKSKRV